MKSLMMLYDEKMSVRALEEALSWVIHSLCSFEARILKLETQERKNTMAKKIVKKAKKKTEKKKK